jgi:hypothetical protein
MESHLTLERTFAIVEFDRIHPDELTHLGTCLSCVGWLHAFGIAASKRLSFDLPDLRDKNSDEALN